MAPPRNVVKIAVQKPDAIPQLIRLDQAKPLAAVVKEVCDAWSLSHSERYALQFADGHRRYITENNRTEIKNGSILCLSTAPDLEAERLLSGLQSGSRERRRETLQHLVLLAPDVTFAQEVISRDGLQRLGTIIEDGDDLGEVLTLTLRAFLELMEHGMVSWETLSIPFIRKVVSYVNMNLMDASVQPLALRLLESVTLSSPALGQLVKSEVPLDRLLVHLQVMNQQLQTKAMALLTALLQGASPTERKHMLDYLWQRNLRQFIYKNIIHSATPLGDEMAHHLYVLQALTLGLLEPRMRTPLDPYSPEQREQLQALRQAAFESEGESLGAGLSADRRRSLCAREFRKLGFSNSNPAQDLERVPPGLLALDNMLYFSRHAPSAYSRFVLENSSREDKHECPFARSSIQLTVLLCELLRVGEPCSETAQDFSPMFFGQDQSFHELFCVSIQLLNKTWKEMRATQEDFDKVIQVVREQLARTLALKPSSLELFRTKVNALPYGEVLRLRQTERLHQEGTLAPPILELREKLKPELMGLIRQQRLLRLYKLWFCCLSPNHKVLQYGDVEEGASPPTLESLPEQLPVADIKALLTGKDCPHVREKGSGKQNKDLYELAFSVSYDHGEEEAYLNFIAPSKREFHLWTDGLSALLGSPMGSEQTRLDLEQLLTMETKLRLLELENVPIPEQPPPIPPPPTNFNFCYDCSITEP
ncbi:engulfment and cell motility protein 3 isoform X2 [Canis lupus baileyi]|uniref:engulfment and cell motility protein 3 isoform X2 n=2 Tax=Canis lupus TaxID=9612 RepID=UPI0015F1391A|nr:engulfment and cell motility protein 3 isoform X2 [Canis lupus familiaris]XP_038394604.1 engulfment and cell motility protein 3 isoform X2 [Canis lupus familiaris]XP_038523320.1 engulfment and cell motility protein 3 isoform X2 [Canis lupus familiaris]